MFHLYILKSKVKGKLYIGYTKDLQRRVMEHNSGFSQSTKPYIPWELVYYESYKLLEDAKDREFKLKHYGQTFRRLKERLAKSLL
jgi:putative endonuclease